MVKKKLAQLNDSKEEQQECCADSNEWGEGGEVVVGGMVPPIQALQS